MDRNAKELLLKAGTKSNAVFSGNLDYNYNPSNDISIVQSEFQPIFPLNNTDNPYIPVEFAIPQSSIHYFDLANSFLELKIKLVDLEGKEHTSFPDLAPVNFAFHSLFSSLEVYVNNVQISSATSFYPIRAVINRMLFTSKEAKDTALAGEFYIPDKVQDTFDRTNAGFVSRQTKARKEIYLLGKLFEPFLMQNKYIIPGCDIRIKLVRSPNTFYLAGKLAENATLNSKVVINHAAFHLRKLTINPKVSVAHNQLLSKGTKFHFPFKNVSLKSFNIMKGTKTYTSEILYSARLPETVIFCMTDAGSQSDPRLSPFNFQHFDIESMNLLIESDISMTKGYKFNFDSNEIMIPYNVASSVLNNSDKHNGITLENYKSGNFFVVYPLFSSGENLTSERQGTLKVQLNFSQALEKTVTVFCYAISQGVLALSGSRDVWLDYNTA